MNIPSIFSQSSLLTPKSFKEELTNLYNAVSVGRETMDKLWVLYWITATLVQDEESSSLCNLLMVKGYLDQEETSKLETKLAAMHKTIADDDFNKTLVFCSKFFDTELLLSVINDNYMDVLAADLTEPLLVMQDEWNPIVSTCHNKVYKKALFESKAFSYFREIKKFKLPERKDWQSDEDYETELTHDLKLWIKDIGDCFNNYRFHGFKKHYLDEIEKKNLI